jgi:hypothetical protein
MFSLRQGINKNRVYDKRFFDVFINDLIRAGFEKIRIKLPHNLVGMEKQEQGLEEFLNRERNYPSLIVVAKNPTSNETIKVLFVNISRKAFFVDDTFPSGHSEPSEIYVKSPDPARAYALLKFFVDYFKGGKRSPSGWRWILTILALFAYVAEALVYAKKGHGLISSATPKLWPVDILIFAFGIIFMFQIFRWPSGLYINEMPKRGVAQLTSMALKGELRDNPLVTIIGSVLATILATLILKSLGVL